METRNDLYGARYWRCALQVNPFAYCEDNAKDTGDLDEDEYTSALIAACIEEGIEVIGITDHHRIESSEKLMLEAEAAGLTVFPGFEFYSKDGVHFLCLFDPGTSIKSVQAKLHDCVDHDGEEPETVGKYDALEFMDKCHTWKGAICVAAHLCSKNGLLKELSNAPRANAWKSEKLFAGCLPGDIDGAPHEHRNILKNKEPEYKRERPVALINANDLSSPNDAGSPSVSCWIKMSDVTVEGLRQAFLDAESRIRLECPEEERTEILSISWEGGFLDGTTINFNENLNVLIGGPGSGKSSVVESIRHVMGIEPATEGVKTSVDSLIKKVIGRGTKISLHVRVRRPAEREYLIERVLPNPPQVREIDGGEVGDLLDVRPTEILPVFDIFGQHEISELARDPTMLTKLLARFVGSSANDDGEISELNRALSANRKQLLELHEEMDEVRSKVGQLPALKQKMKQFKRAKVDEKLGLSQALAEEEQVLASISSEIEAWEEWVDDIQENVEEELPESLDDEELKDLPNVELIKKGRAALELIPIAGRNAHKLLADAVVKAKTDFDAIEVAWEKIRSGNDKAFQKTSRELEKEGIDVDEYLSVLKKLGEISPLEKTAESARKKEDSLRKQRRELLVKLNDARASNFRALEKAAKKVSKRLRSVIRVSTIFFADRQPLFELIRSEVSGQTAQAVKALEELDDLTPSEFADACRAGSEQLQEQFGIAVGTAQRITEAGEEFFLKIEELEFLSQTEIELNIARNEGSEDWRCLEDLSTGQKATAILLLLLLESDVPLIIDQPEDDLDNKFISRDIVSKMRDGKSRRQFIFASHNANIPVLGDAELIVGMEAKGEGGDLHAVVEPENMGSIDKPSVCQLIKEVLEGGDTAFLKRQEKYGF
ncbi:MAG: phosphoesterase [Verrucomicrobiales bacterium]|nr:phosphoesterase [Verrucomicrobiales bacterium]